MKEAMFTFGYKLQLVKKSDLKEYELFEKAVYAIHQQTNDFGQWLRSGFPLNEDIVSQLSIDVEGLHTFIDIYFENKYSSPSSTIMMFNKIDVIRRTAAQMIDVIMEVKKIDTIKARADEQIANSVASFDEEEFLETYKKSIESAMNQINRLISIMLGALTCIRLTIESDMLRLILGVDIMKEHKKRCKRLPKNKDLMTEFTIQYRAISKEDRKFLEKENGKNERRRTRTSDGGVS